MKLLKARRSSMRLIMLAASVLFRSGCSGGAYHFSTNGNVNAQVDHFIETTDPAASDLLVLDFELNGESGTMSLAEAEKFVSRVNTRLNRYPGLYSGQAAIHQQMANISASILKNWFLWIGRYSDQLPEAPPAGRALTFWQYTDSNAGPQPHQVPGIGRCDRDKFNGDVNGLRQL